MTAQQFTVVGSFGERQKALAKLYQAQQHRESLFYHVEREPGNEHDANAIKVLVAGRDQPPVHIGYIPRELAAELAPQMDAGAPVEITRIRITRDWSRGYPVNEVKLTLAAPEPDRRQAYAEVNEVGF